MTSFIWCQKFSFTIMVYSMTVSERTCHEDLKLKKFPKYVEPIKSYGTLNFEFPAILLPRIEQIKNSVNNFTLNRVIPENIHTPPVEEFLDCTPPPLRNFRSEGVFDDPLKKRPPQEFPVLLNMDLFTLSIVIIIIIIMSLFHKINTHIVSTIFAWHPAEPLQLFFFESDN